MLLVKRQVHLSASAKVHEKPVCCGTEIHQRASRQLPHASWDLSAVTAQPCVWRVVQASPGPLPAGTSGPSWRRMPRRTRYNRFAT